MFNSIILLVLFNMIQSDGNNTRRHNWLSGINEKYSTFCFILLKFEFKALHNLFILCCITIWLSNVNLLFKYYIWSLWFHLVHMSFSCQSQVFLFVRWNFIYWLYVTIVTLNTYFSLIIKQLLELLLISCPWCLIFHNTKNTFDLDSYLIPYKKDNLVIESERTCSSF